MPPQHTVLVVGATGRTGQHVLRQLLDRGARVRAIVRSAGRLPADVAAHPLLTLLEASLLSLPQQELRRQLAGCDAVVSCLGHVLSLRGIFGPPRDLVTQAAALLCRSLEALAPAAPVKFILMSSVSVHHRRGLDTRRGALERAFLWLLRGVLPPARDNQSAADFLLDGIRSDNASVQWVVVRPDSLVEGEVSRYELHEELVSDLRSPASTSRANVAHFMCELVTDPEAWSRWRGKLPVVINAGGSRGG